MVLSKHQKPIAAVLLLFCTGASMLFLARNNTAFRRHALFLHEQNTTSAADVATPPQDTSCSDETTPTTTSTSWLSEVYQHTPAQPTPTWCAERFELDYIQRLASSRQQYCRSGRTSSFECYGTSITADKPRTDYFCVADSVFASRAQEDYSVDCQLEDPYFIERLPTYVIGTGLQDTIHSLRFTDSNATVPTCSHSSMTIVLVNRKSIHTWDSLLEIFSYYLTIDTLFTARPDISKDNIQIVLTDDFEDGPYLDLWDFFSSHPTIRLHDFWQLEDTSCIERIIYPLPEGSNPLFQAEWLAEPCTQSPLIDAFRQRVFQRYNEPESAVAHPDSKPVVTMIKREHSRALLDQEQLLESIAAKYPDIDFQLVDLATMDFFQQLRTISQTNLLVGVHGAGLTHIYFLPYASSVVEILPVGLGYRGFRNLALMRGQRYFSAHAATTDDEADWHHQDVSMPAETFRQLMRVAIGSIDQRGYVAVDVT